MQILLNLAFCNIAFAESFYFKKCLLNEVVSADYLIDLENKIINAKENIYNLESDIYYKLISSIIPNI